MTASVLLHRTERVSLDEKSYGDTRWVVLNFHDDEDDSMPGFEVTVFGWTRERLLEAIARDNTARVFGEEYVTLVADDA